jgi:hypothetical protein
MTSPYAVRRTRKEKQNSAAVRREIVFAGSASLFCRWVVLHHAEVSGALRRTHPPGAAPGLFWIADGLRKYNLLIRTELLILIVCFRHPGIVRHESNSLDDCRSERTCMRGFPISFCGPGSWTVFRSCAPAWHIHARIGIISARRGCFMMSLLVAKVSPSGSRIKFLHPLSPRRNDKAPVISGQGFCSTLGT